MNTSTSEIATPQTDKEEYHESCNFDVDWPTHARALERELITTKDALRRAMEFARHKPECVHYNDNAPKSCDCEFEQLRNEVGL